jgi:hypothetical protein
MTDLYEPDEASTETFTKQASTETFTKQASTETFTSQTKQAPRWMSPMMRPARCANRWCRGSRPIQSHANEITLPALLSLMIRASLNLLHPVVWVKGLGFGI